MADGPRPGPPPRVPPNNLRAEESVLGAMLLSREAIAEVVEILDPDHFYKPAHGHLYDAILSLYSGGEPVDAVTVADELKRAGLLEEVGGPAVLLDFQATTPAISNAAHYAKIVEEHALLRRMITVSNEIAETAYGIPEDVTKAVDDAESRMFDVAQRRVANTMAPIKDLLPANLDRIEMLYDRGEAITGLSTGYLDLDEKLAGLQPSALYVVGARPAMGKALALDTPIPTPAGWSTMGALEVGDTVFDERGEPCSVTYTSPIYTDHECFEIVFDDGSSIVADAEHQWLTWDNRAWRSKREHDARRRRGPAEHPELARDQGAKQTWPAVRTTAEIASSLTVRSGGDERPNHRVPVAGPLELPDADLPLDPYVLGCWLGDGHTGKPQITTMDTEIVGAFADAGWSLDEARPAGSATTYVIRSPLDATPNAGQVGGRRMLAFTRALRACGLWEPRPKGSTDAPSGKHIPSPYLRASTKQRLALLQGIMDTDGHAGVGATCELAMSNRRLVADTRELALSLGYKVGPLRHKRSNFGTDVWRITFSAPEAVFRLARKVDAQQLIDRPNSTTRWRVIKDVRPTDPVPVQCITVDSPSHLYLAGHDFIPTHNTAFALGLAANSAMKDERPVLIFTLEMSQLELSQRLLCSDALVDAGRVKTGRLEEGEWTRITHAVGRLAEAPIYIDDNPHTSVMDIRAKARRLKSREGDLGMVVVDYIQLMTGRSNAESRQVEVSEISRNLKILARELDAPVVALAQLNRGLEQRTDKRPMLSDLRESGCMPATTRVALADGTETTMGELVESGATPDVLAVDDRQRIVRRRLLKAFPSGTKPVYRMTLASGAVVDATGNHEFLTIDGWRPLDDLRPGGTYIATPRALPEPFESKRWPDHEVVLLAHMLGDGSFVDGVKYASADPANIEAVLAAAEAFGCPGKYEGDGTAARTGAIQLWFPAGYRLARGTYHPFRNWLEPMGLWGRRSGQKFVPDPIFSLSNEQVGLFLHHLWSTDGSLTIDRRASGPPVRCYYATSSRRLADDVQRLLRRFGIRGRISTVSKPGYGDGYHVGVTGCTDQLAFLENVGCHGARGRVVSEAIEILSGVKANPNVDLIPGPVRERVKAAMVGAGVSHRQLAARLGEDYCGSYLLGSATRDRRFSRDRLRRIGHIAGDGHLVDIATSDLFWDEIVDITPLGDQAVYDLTVDIDHNFIANGVVAHNSLEQDADVVLFLYRDEVYDEASPDKGVAEVIIAKHRNGPTGKARLAFRGQYTRFDNMARTVPPGGGPSGSSGPTDDF